MMDRRAFVSCSAAGLVSCGQSRGEYFGSTEPPLSRTLVHTLGGEPDTLDPAKSAGGMEFWVIPALFEGLTQHHPRLPQPMAALATHYEVSARQDRFTFYLRGHPAPRGILLPRAEDLPVEFTRGKKTAPETIPALWTDSRPITAHDFVYSWRRLLDPRTAAPMAYQLYCLENAEDVNVGKRSPRDLGVRAVDDFTLQVDLQSPMPFFLQLITQYWFSPVPRQAIEAALRWGDESSWTEPDLIVVSGAFTLQRWQRYENITALKNPLYYGADVVAIDKLVFMPVADGTTAMNLYRSGVAAVMPGFRFPPIFTPVVAHKKDFHAHPAFGTVSPTISTRRPPFDRVLLRYALNMATEKQAFCDFLGGGRVPAYSLVPPVPGYPRRDSLHVDVDGSSVDILSFNVEAARALLAKAGFRPQPNGNAALEIPYHFPALPEARPKGEILQQQWLRNLGIRLNLVVREFRLHWKMVLDGDYTGVANFAFLPLYFDPNPFLDPFLTAGPGNPTGWTRPRIIARCSSTRIAR